jgi:hypothetical protein
VINSYPDNMSIVLLHWMQVLIWVTRGFVEGEVKSRQRLWPGDERDEWVSHRKFHARAPALVK